MKLLLSFFVLLNISQITAQNLPSLLTKKNINATFSILAYDENSEEWGIAVATNNIYVGNSTIYIEPQIGAFSVIAETEPRYAIEGIQKLKEGKTIEQSISEVKNTDSGSNYRQVSGIDANGNVFAFTGESLKYWNGKASFFLGKNYVVMGNQLADGVISKMSTIFESTKGTLAERLLKSLLAGQEFGGQISGKQSAALVVKGAKNEWFNQIDLRVDNSKNPFKELQTLMNYHYGRIRLNQSIYATRSGNKKRGAEKLLEAESLLDGWTGMYSKIAAAHISLENEDAAVGWIKKGLSENPKWFVNLPAFYFLRNHSEMKSIMKPEEFTIRDWENAMRMLSLLGQELEVIELGKNLIEQGKESSYLYFLLGRSYYYEKELEKALVHIDISIKKDGDNIEAQNLMRKIRQQ